MIPIPQRCISIILYIFLLPDIISYGNGLYNNIQLADVLNIIIMTIVALRNSLPIGNFLFFIILFLAVVKNHKIPYFLRYNSMQMILIKLILIIIEYIYVIAINLFNIYFIKDLIEAFLFVGMLTIITFSIIQCLRGMEADLPLISDAVKMQI